MPAKGPVQAITSATDKRQQIRIDHIGMGSRHAVRVALVGLQCAVGQQLRRQYPGIFIRYDLVIVEGVQNEHLYEALKRWGWKYDPGVSDFYWPRTVEASRALDARPPRRKEKTNG